MTTNLFQSYIHSRSSLKSIPFSLRSIPGWLPTVINKSLSWAVVCKQVAWSWPMSLDDLGASYYRSLPGKLGSITGVQLMTGLCQPLELKKVYSWLKIVYGLKKSYSWLHNWCSWLKKLYRWSHTNGSLQGREQFCVYDQPMGDNVTL